MRLVLMVWWSSHRTESYMTEEVKRDEALRRRVVASLIDDGEHRRTLCRYSLALPIISLDAHAHNLQNR